MNIMNLIGQLGSSSNPLAMVMNMLPNNNQKQAFQKLANTDSEEQKAQILADLCNKNGITKKQLEQAFSNMRKR